MFKCASESGNYEDAADPASSAGNTGWLTG